MGNQVEARRYYELAAEKSDDLPPEPYGDLVREGISRGFQRLGLSRDAPAWQENTA